MTPTPDIRDSAYAIATHELQPGEKLLFATHPHPRSLLRASGCVVFLGWFLALQGAVVLYIASDGLWGLLPSPVKEGQSAAGAAVLGLPILLLGLWIATGRRRVGPILQRTVFAITNQRMLEIRCRGERTRVESIPGEELRYRQVYAPASGMGSIFVYRDGPLDPATGWPRSKRVRWVFAGMADAQVAGRVLEDTFGPVAGAG